MEDLDFTRPVRSAAYDPEVARRCFEALGRPEAFAQGQPFFSENQPGDKMYLLLEGEASLIRGSKVIDIVKAGEIFGELAAISRLPRSASAVARTACRAISLDAAQFQRAVRQRPEFALMLMGILVNRLRLTARMLSVTRSLSGLGEWRENRVFDDRLLGELERALEERPHAHHPAGKVIVREGEAGVFLYVVLSGRVAISIQSTVVERVGPGGVFGEMALVDQSPRAATAVAETDCELLAVSRADFLALVKSRPEFGLALLRGIAERLRFMTSGFGR